MAIGVAAKTLADISDDLQLTVVVLGEIQVFRANAQRDRRADTLACTVDRQADARSGVQFHLATGAVDAAEFAFEKAHFRRAEKACDEQVGRMVIQLQRRTDLFDLAAIEHHHLVGQGHGFDLIVSHVNHGGLQLFVQARQLQTRLHAQRGVEVGQRFVEQKDFRVAHDGPADGHTLTLTSRQLLGFAFQQRAELQNARGFIDLSLDLGLVATGQVQRKGQVLAHGHVRIQRVGLEHHRQVTLGWSDLGDVAAIEFDGARGHFFKPGDQSQQGGLATARRADENHELTVFYVQIDTFDDLVTVKAFLQIADAQVSHVGLLLVLGAGAI